MHKTEFKTGMINPKISLNKFWFALYTKPKHEFKAEIYLNSVNVENYLPTITTLKKWSDRKKKIKEPLFKGYIFVHCCEKERYEALQNESIISTICFEGKPAHIPDWQIENLKKFLAENRHVFISDKIEVGTKVEIIEGPFAGIRGIVSQTDDNYKVLGITIDLLKRTILVKLPNESLIKILKEK